LSGNGSAEQIDGQVSAHSTELRNNDWAKRKVADLHRSLKRKLPKIGKILAWKKKPRNVGVAASDTHLTTEGEGRVPCRLDSQVVVKSQQSQLISR